MNAEDNAYALAVHYYYVEGMYGSFGEALDHARREEGLTDKRAPLTTHRASNPETLTRVDVAEGEGGHVAGSR